jgi:hypothetical protein
LDIKEKVMKFSKTTGCFYPDDIQYPNPPADLIAVTGDDYNAAMSRPTGATLDVQGGKLVIVPAPTPTAAQLLAQAQQAQLAIVGAACAAAITGGFQSSALGKAYTYPSQQTDQANLNANVVSSLLPGLPANWTTLQLCCDENGKWGYVPHTAAQIQQVGDEGKAAILGCLTKHAELKAQIAAATTVAEVQAINW